VKKRKLFVGWVKVLKIEKSAVNLTYLMPGFAGGILRDRTGVNDDQVGIFHLPGYLMAGLLERLRPGFQFRFVQAAT